MSKLNLLCGKSKIYHIGEVNLDISPRTLDELDLILDLAESEKRTKAMQELIKRTLKQAVPDATDEEVKNVAIQYFKELSEAIVEVNGLKQDDKSENTV
jgi:hypothetical protein